MNKKIKVHIVSPTESEITERGKRHPHLAEHLVSKGIDVNYVTSTINHAAKRIFNAREQQKGKENANYPITFLDSGLYTKNISIERFFWNHKFAYKVYRNLKNTIDKGDIVLIPSRPPELLVVGKFLKVRHGVKLLLDIEDIWPDAFKVNNKLLKTGFSLYCNTLNNHAIPHFDSAVHVSPNFKGWLRRYDSKATSTFTPLGINKSELKKENRKYYNSKLKDVKLFYGGTLTLQFDILPILKAINRSDKTFHISLAGDDGSGERFEKTINFLEEHGINYENHGLLKKEHFINKLGESDIAIVPMISGGLPKKFYDAIGSFKPVLCLGKGGAYEEVKKYDLGWNTSFKVNEIVDTLDRINADNLNKKIAQISENVHQYLEEHSLKTIHNEILKLVNGI